MIVDWTKFTTHAASCVVFTFRYVAGSISLACFSALGSRSPSSSPPLPARGQQYIEIINQREVKIDKKMIAKYLRCSLIFIRHSAIGWSIGTFIYYLYQFSALLSSLYKQQMRHSITSWTFLVSPLFSFVYLKDKSWISTLFLYSQIKYFGIFLSSIIAPLTERLISATGLNFSFLKNIKNIRRRKEKKKNTQRHLEKTAE